MNKEIKKLSKNTVYTFSSNITSFIINALVVLIIPKMIGISEYGYFQLYLLLATYALYFHFGWCDGIYLINVGRDYNQLDREMLSSQFVGIVMMSAAVSMIMLVCVFLFCRDANKLWVYLAAIMVVFLVTPKTYTSVVMQMTNRMKNYSQIVLIEKAVYAVVLLAMLLAGVRDFRLLILSDCIGKLSALGLGCFFCRDIIKTKITAGHIEKYVKEAALNIKVGIFLLISNLASLLITGIVQFCIEHKWDIETFSKVSLTFSMSKMLMVAITAMSIVLVPMLKHMNNKQLSNMYKGIRSVLMILLGGMLVFYYPIKLILLRWLPQYSESIHYMALLFPMCLFESKTQLLLNTYLKALREERKLCLVNFITVILSAMAAYISVFRMKSLNLAILLIPYLLAFRCLLLEYYIGKKLNISLLRESLIEVALATVFIVVSWKIDSVFSMLIYAVVYLAYLAYAKDKIKYIAVVIRHTDEGSA